MKYFFLGMPGSGKSTIGTQFATFKRIPFFDLDNMITERQGMSVSEIINIHGLSYFRELEVETVQSLVQGRNSAFVLSLGGGTPSIDGMMAYLNENGLSIFLNASINTIIQRILGDITRPLFIDETNMPMSESALRLKLLQLYHDRIEFYRQAKYHFDEHATIEDIDNGVEHEY